MEEDKISNKNLLNVVKHGHAWSAEKVKEVLETTIENNSSLTLHHYLRYDLDNKYYYIYDRDCYNKDCYLFIFNGVIKIRCDRDIGSSSDKTYTRQIKKEDDVASAYQLFLSLIAEDKES